MSIDVFGEAVVSFSEAAKKLPKARNGKKIHVSTIYRWSVGGSKNHAGEIVRLETIKIGGTTCTSLEALQRFFERLSSQVPIVEAARRTTRQREAAIRRAEKELNDARW